MGYIWTMGYIWPSRVFFFYYNTGGSGLTNKSNTDTTPPWEVVFTRFCVFVYTGPDITHTIIWSLMRLEISMLLLGSNNILTEDLIWLLSKVDGKDPSEARG